jgi:hypothetical protein
VERIGVERRRSAPRSEAGDGDDGAVVTELPRGHSSSARRTTTSSSSEAGRGRHSLSVAPEQPLAVHDPRGEAEDQERIDRMEKANRERNLGANPREPKLEEQEAEEKAVLPEPPRTRVQVTARSRMPAACCSVV